MYSERAYFDGDHCAHVADYQEKHPLVGRLAGITRRNAALVRSVERRRGSRYGR